MRTAGAAFICLLLSACAGTDGAQGLDGIRGPLGPMGAMGLAGERGPAGPAGTGYRPVFWVACGATLDLIRVGAAGAERGVDGLEETRLAYALLVYSNGDVEAQCTAQIGTAQDGSASIYYPEPTVGASTGTCIASADFSSGGINAGFWSFDVATGSAPRAAYVDADNPLGFNGFSYKYSESDCRAKMMSDTGKWADVTLSDVF